MITIGIDLGNKSRTGIAVMSSDNYTLLHHEYTVYNQQEYRSPLAYRMHICDRIMSCISNYDADYLLYERINLFKGGGISPLANIISMCKLQTTIINNLSEEITICDVDVRSWKSKVLGSGNAGKDASIDFVHREYPDVDLNIIVNHPRKKITETIINHDLADSICIARASIILGEDWMDKHKVNFS